MRFCATGFILPKENHTEYECDDAFLYDATNKFRFAIADTAGSYSNKWAHMLVADYIQFGENEYIQRIGCLQRKWRDAINWNDLPFYLREKAMQGDFSTFSGISFYPAGSNSGRWEALAVGDSCLFHIRDNSLLCSFPIQYSVDFNDYPQLLSSITSYNKLFKIGVKTSRGNYAANDLFLLATDAAASWFLASCENGEKPWCEICELRDHADFTSFILSLRQSGKIMDDDVTIVRIELKNLELMIA